TKLTAFAIGASFSGAMGVIYAANRTFVSPETFSLTASISILVMVILGGLGSIPG
ncbi:MAG: branched-chain amino acid ABC transporter permease, partial [Caldilineaceae bacterium]|nr:branched-chain amino acid ABC transporter permease [Caldilineaceae bacterium]